MRRPRPFGERGRLGQPAARARQPGRIRRDGQQHPDRHGVEDPLERPHVRVVAVGQDGRDLVGERTR
ncbi:hypothetical protein [Streptomyces sp. NPDC054854]